MTDARIPMRRVLISLLLAFPAPVATADAVVPPGGTGWQAQVIRQTEDVTCLPAALASLLRFRFGREVGQDRIVAEMLGGRSLSQIRAQGGFSLGDALDFVEAHDLSARGEDGLEPSDLEGRLPAILQTQADGGGLHFVVVLAREGELFAVADPASGGTWMTATALRSRWTGIAFFVTEPDLASAGTQ
jgi:uncharacterized protein